MAESTMVEPSIQQRAASNDKQPHAVAFDQARKHLEAASPTSPISLTLVPASPLRVIMHCSVHTSIERNKGLIFGIVSAPVHAASR